MTDGKIIDYEIITAETSTASRVIRERLSTGWELHGQGQFTPIAGGLPILTQPMVKREQSPVTDVTESLTVETLDSVPFLRWIYDRMHRVHHERVNVDYMQRFKQILDRLEA